MVAVRLRGGLGNQMFQYAAGYALSRRLGTELKLDADWYHVPETEYREEYRRLELSALRVSAPRLNRLDRLRRRLAIMQSPKSRRFPLRQIRAWVGFTRFEDASVGYDPAFETLGDGTYLDGFWQSERYFADFGTELRAAFRPGTMEALQDDAHYRAIVAHPASVCVHVRRGDFLHTPGFGILDPGYYARAVAHLRTRLTAAAFWIFSDDPAWCAQHLDLGEDVTVVPRQASRPPGLDLAMMAASRHFVVANSTFSWWAAWLGAAPDKTVVAPADWGYGTDQYRADLVPAAWVRL